MPCFSRLFRLAVLILMLPSMTGCGHWTTVDQPVPVVVNNHPGTPLRITLLEGVPFDADSGLVRLDSLVAWRTPDPLFVTDLATGERVRRGPKIQIIALTEIRRVHVRSPGPDGLVFGVIVGVAAVGLLMSVTIPKCTGGLEFVCR